MTTTLTGELLIGARAVRGSEASFRGLNPATGLEIEPPYAGAGPAELENACQLAFAAFDSYRETTLEERAHFLETIAARILALGDELIVRAMAETGLARARLEGERGRTVGQLRLFAAVVREGSWLDVRIDPAQPQRKPAPRPDLRLRQIGLGPVAVFGASNFPLAFSVAGGDTAAALAAGCPVVVKAHPAHPGTSELVGRAIGAAIAECKLPDGVFSLLFGVGNWLGGALVAHPRIQAVGFTGSRAGGLALVNIAAQRPEPIPVYAEMSSINPVLLMPGALQRRGAAMGRDFVGSLTLGAGQFCTNPGLVLALPGPGLDEFIAASAKALADNAGSTMLTPAICRAFHAGTGRLAAHEHVETVAQGAPGRAHNTGRPAFFATDAENFMRDATLREEVFGAAAVLVRCADVDTMRAVVEDLEGQLTITLHMEEEDTTSARSLLPTLERKAGRLLVNGWPTGVEVSDAMVHGGPFPATSDGRSTSVGTLAIRRFLRPICYQDFPQALLSDALRDGNPLRIPHRSDGAPIGIAPGLAR